MGKRISAGLLCLLCLLALAACKPRTGASPPPASSKGDAPAEGEAPSDSGEDGGATAEDAPPPEEEIPVDAQAEAQKLLDDGLVALISNYNNENFDKTSQLNPSQMLWSVYQWSAAQPGYKAHAPDYDGYAQMPAKEVDSAADRWYGPDSPRIEGNPAVLGEAMSGELINLDPEKGMYYFLEAGEPSEERLAEVKDSRAEKGVVTFRFSTEHADGTHASTYVIKAARAEDGTFYVTSMNRGA